MPVMPVGLTKKIGVDTPLHKTIVKELEYRIRMSERKFSNMRDKWAECEDRALAFMPERDADTLRKNVRTNEGLPQYTTIAIPYTYAVMMAAHTYWCNVFLSRSPIFQYQGLNGESQQQEMAVEALIEYQRNAGTMLPALFSWLYDVGRYGTGVLGMYWEDRVNHITQIYEATELNPISGKPTGVMQKYEETTEVQGYSGNKLYNVRPQDFLADPRVPLSDFQRGEFAFVRRKISWAEVKRREKQGFYMNVDKIDATITDWVTGMSNRNQSTLVTPDSPDGGFGNANRDSGSGMRGDQKQHPDIVPIYEGYIELIPEDWKLASRDYPEKWVFTLTGDKRTLIGVQPLGALHNEYPFRLIQLEPDAYALASRAISNILGSVEDTINWLVNTHFYNVRASLNNQFVFDPSRITVKDLQNGLPGKLIRAKPTAYGSDLRTSIFQLPVNDITQGHMKDLPEMLGIGERIMGVNDQMLGMLATGGRKTATEVRTSSSFGVNRLKTISEYMSSTGFEPLGNMLLRNSQQYYDAERKMRIVGNLAQYAGAPFIQVDAASIAGDFGFVPVDGTLPIDRMAQAKLWTDMLAQAIRIPPLAQGLDWMKLFMWIAQLSGLRNADQMKLQIMPNQQLAGQVQSGQMVPAPVPGNGAGPPATGQFNPGVQNG
jgi:hypothetical protein